MSLSNRVRRCQILWHFRLYAWRQRWQRLIKAVYRATDRRHRWFTSHLHRSLERGPRYYLSDRPTDNWQFRAGDVVLIIRWQWRPPLMECWHDGRLVYVGRDVERARRALQRDKLAWDTLLLTKCEFLEDYR